jgi:hypothetical protein
LLEHENLMGLHNNLPVPSNVLYKRAPTSFASFNLTLLRLTRGREPTFICLVILVLFSEKVDQFESGKVKLLQSNFMEDKEAFFMTFYDFVFLT